MLRVFFEEFPCSPLKNDGLKTILSLTKHKFSGDEKKLCGGMMCFPCALFVGFANGN